MEKLNFKTITKNMVLIFLIIIIIGYNFYYFLIAPIRTNEKRIENIVFKFSNEAIFINEFLEYVVVEENNQLVFLAEDSTVMVRFDVRPIRNSEYGILDGQLLLIEKTKESETWINYETKEIILRQEW